MATRKRVSRKKPEPEPPAQEATLQDVWDEGMATLEEVMELKEDRERLEFLVSRSLYVVKKGPPDLGRYYLALRTRIVSKGFEDFREAIDSERLKK